MGKRIDIHQTQVTKIRDLQLVFEEEEDVDFEEETESDLEELHRERKKKLKVIEESLRNQLEERREILAELEESCGAQKKVTEKKKTISRKQPEAMI